MRGKGIVVEISSNNKVIVMTSQGEFKRVPFSKPVSVGQEIQFTSKRRQSFWQWSVAAVIMVALVGSASMVNDSIIVPGGNDPVYFVTLDINPSIELAVNREQRVIKAEGLNEDGKKLLGKLRVSGYSFKQAVEVISRQAELDGYLRSGENDVVVTILSPESDEPKLVSMEEIRLDRTEFSIHDELEDAIVETLTTVYKANVHVWQAPINVRQEARQAGLSPAHYIAIHIETRQETVEATTQTVTTSVERQGEQRVFEFQVKRPVLTPETWTRQPESSQGFATFQLVGQTTRAKGEQTQAE